MSEINKSNLAPLNTEQLLEAYRAGRGSVNGQILLGMETENWFVSRAGVYQDRIRMMTPAQSQRVLARLAETDGARTAWEKAGQRINAPVKGAPLVLVDTGKANYQLELCGVVEIATAPTPASAVREQISRLREAQDNLEGAARAEGLLPLRWAVPGSITPQICAANMVKRERLLSEWAKFKAEGADSPGLRTMGLATSTQASLSYRDPQEAAEIITLGNLMSPVLYSTFANSTGYIEGNASATMPRPQWWQQHNQRAPRAGIPAPILQRMFAGNPRSDMLGDWVDFVKTVPMVYFLDEKSQPRFDTSPSFNELAQRGLGTASNFSLAESLLWPDVKIIAGQRIELRMCDAGPWQGEALAVLAAGVFADPAVRRETIRTLKSFNQLTADGLQKSLTAVAAENFAAPYGTRAIRDQLPLLRELVVDARQRLKTPSESTARLEEVLATGQSDFLRAQRQFSRSGALKADLAGVRI
jgi:gamma-glutamylcysteine synthetase